MTSVFLTDGNGIWINGQNSTFGEEDIICTDDLPMSSAHLQRQLG
jgi:hypothetical protein